MIEEKDRSNRQKESYTGNIKVNYRRKRQKREIERKLDEKQKDSRRDRKKVGWTGNKKVDGTKEKGVKKGKQRNKI